MSEIINELFSRQRVLAVYGILLLVLTPFMLAMQQI